MTGTLEAELRSLTGEAVADDDAWDLVRRLNGWGPNPPQSYQLVAKETGIDKHKILELARSCRRVVPERAPMLDSALRLTLAHPDQDPQDLALSLATLGITENAFCLAGLSEAARRFGRFDEWTALVRQLAANRSRTARPRPFDSWFELDVFLYVTGLGHRVIPQKRIGNYRVDLLLPDFVPQLVIECDGDRYHGRDRAHADEVREAELLKRGYYLLRFRYSDYVAKPHSIKSGLVEVLSRPETIGLQLRAG
jgi:very-short-patch-repair endonuclease